MAKKDDGALVLAGAPTTVAEIFTGEYALQEMAKVASKHTDPERLLHVAKMALGNEGKLGKCTALSFMTCMIDLSAVGLEPDGYHAYLIPYGEECTLLVDYKGYIQIIYRDPNVANVFGEIVCKGELVNWDAATHTVSDHVVDITKPRGEMIAAYTCITDKEGRKSYHLMLKDEIEATRNESAAWKNFVKTKKKCPWNTHPHEMEKKTVLHQHKKWLKLTPETQRSLTVDDSHQFPQYVKQEHVTGEDISNVPNGKRTKLRPAEDVKDAVTENVAPKDDVDITVKIAALEELDTKEMYEMCKELGIAYVPATIMQNDGNVVALYNLLQMKNEK